MILQDIPALRSHLVHELAALSDADPGALADYIIALLKHEKAPEELRAFCISQLEDFLHSNASQFVDQMFKFILGKPTGMTNQQQMHAIPSQDSRPTSGSVTQEEQHMMEGEGAPLKDAEQDDGEDEDEGEDSDDYRRRRRRRHDWEGRSRSRSRERNERPINGHYRHVSGGDHYSGRRGGRRSNFLSGPPPPFPPFLPPLGMPPPPLPTYSGASAAVPYYETDARQMTSFNGASGMMGEGARSSTRQPRRYVPRGGRSETRLVIDKIPQEYCSISKVNEYFQRFGTIVNITVQPELSRARIQYSSHEEAQRAYHSPEVIFENRFVKVYWDAEETLSPAAPSALGRIAVGEGTRSMAFPSSTSMMAVTNQGVHSPQQPPSIDPVAIKRQEALRGMLELQKQKQELMQKYIAQQKELLSRLSNKTLADAERTELIRSLKSVDELIRSLNPSSAPTTAISGETEKVSKESAEEHGQKANEPTTTKTVTPILRGGPAFRGRGAGATAFRGGWARGGMAAGHAWTLDLRPTCLLLQPIPARLGRDIGSLRKFFEPYGEIKTISLVEDGAAAMIVYVKRADAEKAMFYVPKSELGEPFELSWAPSTTPQMGSRGGYYSASSEQEQKQAQEGSNHPSVAISQTCAHDDQDNTSPSEHIAFDEQEEDYWKR